MRKVFLITLLALIGVLCAGDKSTAIQALDNTKTEGKSPTEIPGATNSKSTAIQALDSTKIESKALLEIPEASFDFGISVAGHRMTNYFTIKSAGEDPLFIERVRATCGCTAAQPEKTELEPGDSTTIRVTFNSNGYNGRKARKSIKITSNDKERKIKSMTFSVLCDTTKYTVLKPNPVFVDIGRDDFETETKFLVQNISQQDVELSVVAYDRLIIKSVKIKDKKLKPGEETNVELKIFEDAESNKIREASVTIQANDENNSRITIPINGGMHKASRHPKRPTPKTNTAKPDK